MYDVVVVKTTMNLDSNIMNPHLSKIKDILSTAKLWDDIKFELSKYNTSASLTTSKNTLAGVMFECFAKYYFMSIGTEKSKYANVWLFNDIPLHIRERLNIGMQDYGVDIVLEDVDGKLYAVQCKYKNDETTRLNWSADKIANLFAFCPNADGYIVFSNASNLDEVSKSRQENFMFYSIANLLELDSEAISDMYDAICLKTKQKTFITPRKHQLEAIESCVDGFNEGSRGQLILPCGAGKTYAALWIKEALHATKTLVLVPSLALLRQIKNEWTNQRKSPYRYLCVCSESDIDKETDDSMVTHTYEIDINVTTDPVQIKKFLQSDYPEKVIFSTYHSLEAIAKAIEDYDFEFDYIFCDEAHKTAGVGKNRYSLVHDNKRIPATRRLYATATPRIVKESIKKKLGDDLKYAYDMNDPAVFGKEFYRMTFKDAIEQDILVDYKIVAIGVNDVKLREYIKSKTYIDAKTSIDEVANCYALEQIMQKYNATHALTFHSRIKYAEAFALRHSNLFSTVNTFYVSGEQTTSCRNLRLNEFKNSSRATMSNARCLTEGVDIPAIDLVYFCDPKNSKVDIVQAAGRALRKKDGKKQGLIVVPVYHSDAAKVEDAISQSSFKNLIQVIRALCDQDERLQDEISQIAYNKKLQPQNNRIEFSNLEFEETGIISLEGFEADLKESLFDQVIAKSTGIWEMHFAQFKDYMNKNDDYPTAEDDNELLQWISQQRQRRNKGLLSADKINRLNGVNFIWDGQKAKWDGLFDKLVLFRNENPNRWPVYDRGNKESLDSKLSNFCQVMRKRYRENDLTEYWLEKLLSIDFNFDGIQDNWTVRCLEMKGILNDMDTISIELLGDNYHWLARQKKSCNLGELSKKQEQMMESLNLDRFFESWDSKFERTKEWVTISGKLPTNTTHKEFTGWLMSQRTVFNNSNLSDEQIKKLESIGFDLYAKGDEKRIEMWNQKYEQLKVFISDNDNQWPKPSGKGEEFTLYNWCQSQRQTQQGTAKKRKPLDQWKVDKLDVIGFVWSLDDRWERYYQQLKEFLGSSTLENLNSTTTLYTWLYNQTGLFEKGNYDTSRVDKLLELGIDVREKLGRRTNTWLENMKEIAKFVREHGHYPKSNGELIEKRLYKFLHKAKKANDEGRLTDDQLAIIAELNITL